MTLAELQPFSEAIRALAARGVLPTNLGSAELQQLGAGFHRQNFTSARTLLTDLLEGYKADLEKILNPTTETNPETGLPRTVGMDAATARLNAKQLLQKLGYSPETNERGTIKDLGSDARINLVIQTNKDVMTGAGQFIQSQDEDVLVAYPAWELFRLEARQAERNWKARFRICAEVVGDVDAARVLAETGRMMARKDSPIWQALGDGQDGSTDTLGNPFPPFAFNSGMDVRDIARSEAIRLGLVRAGEVIQSTLPDDLAQLFSAN